MFGILNAKSSLSVVLRSVDPLGYAIFDILKLQVKNVFLLKKYFLAVFSYFSFPYDTALVPVLNGGKCHVVDIRFSFPHRNPQIR